MITMNKDKRLAERGHRDWKIGDTFLADNGSKWVVMKSSHWSVDNCSCAACYEGELAGHIKHLSHIRLK